ncbi:hypothetical protein K488DRAFT_85359 [Vararia minispora EC-137]|uniref:Uncharacterized protein n=1 Tax=Vararia minispora EC-137 TaxID=1314806 RepID=A0ACB8QNQ6_9AGAM|nr:hypothetical protein K488DRAFT_85359 [Vararia minispora EC-137]
MSQDLQPPSKRHKRALSSETTNILRSCLAQTQSMIAALASSAELTEIVDRHPFEELSQMLAAKLSGRVTYDFRGLKEVTLEGLDIVPAECPLLLDQDQIPAVVSDSADRAKGRIWSSDMLFRHLNMLNDFASPNVAGARLWINAFFFRVNAMLDSADKGLVLSLEQRLDVPVGPRTVLGGFVDYAVLRGLKTVTGRFFPSSDLTLQRNRDSLSFFVEEVKSFDVSIEHFLPQTVGEMYAGMKAMQKDFIRGALTNGRTWIFIVVEAKESGGATYHRTSAINLFDPPPSRMHYDRVLLKPRCDLVASIIAHWASSFSM